MSSGPSRRPPFELDSTPLADQSHGAAHAHAVRVISRTWAQLCVFVLALLLAAAPAVASPEQPLFDAIQKDPSFKVRMQAIRVLTKRVAAKKGPASEEVMAVLGRAATDDENYLVRGLACFSLGQLGDGRARAPLLKAREDVHPFVREQAEEGLRQVPTTGPEPGLQFSALPLPERSGVLGPNGALGLREPGGGRSLILDVEQVAEGAVTHEALGRLRGSIEDHVRQSAAGFAIGRREGSGYRFSASIADKRVDPNGAGKVKVSMVIRITIASWPENHLRHVVTARATAETAASSESARNRLEQRVLEAAVKQAVTEAMAEISREYQR